MKNIIKIGDKEIGSGRTYVIAEFGVNHLGSLERAKEGIIKAAEAGADAIKFQTYTGDDLVVKGTPKFWKSEGGDVGNDQHEAYKLLGGFPWEWYPELIKTCEEHNIEFLSTPFSFEAADYLNSIGMKAFKVASSDMSTLPYLEHIAKYNKPILLSTGASTLEEILEAVNTIREHHNKIVIMHCNLCYPTKDEDANLNMIKTLKLNFPDFPIGLSDHTLGPLSTVIAVGMGAELVEKHYTTDKTLPDSADHWLSVDPPELKFMVDGIRQAEKLRGKSERVVFESEAETRKLDKRSLVSKVRIPKGTKITEDMITYKRPGTGIWPRDLKKVIGLEALFDIEEDTTIKWEHVLPF